MKGRLQDFSREELDEMASCMGRILLAMPATAAVVRHSRPIKTLRDYMRVTDLDTKPERAAKEYLLDFVGGSWGGTTEEILQKWFHGTDDDFEELPPPR